MVATRGPPTPDHLGFLAIDKSGGMTSHDVVARVRRLAGMRKVGHAGTLDPMATGLLVVALGPATRLLRYVQADAKEYVAEVCFGVATDSLDADGTEVARSPMAVTRERLADALDAFVGEIDQVPPMVSAIKQDGVRLHELARQGIEVEREPRRVTIHHIRLLGFEPGEYPTATLEVGCGSGTYIRTLADDIARSLGGRAHLTALRRTAIGPIGVDSAVTLEGLAERGVAAVLRSPADALAGMASVEVDEPDAERVSHGRPLDRAVSAERVAVLDPLGRLLAVYRADGPRIVAETVLPT
jgi:tRNA pseudouridine55 synthase